MIQKWDVMKKVYSYKLSYLFHTMVAERRAILTMIMNGLVRRLASNGLQISNKDRWDLMEPFEQTQYIPYRLEYAYDYV